MYLDLGIIEKSKYTFVIDDKGVEISISKCMWDRVHKESTQRKVGEYVSNSITT